MAKSKHITKTRTLKIKHALPESVVLPPSGPDLTQRFDSSGAIWFCAEPGLLVAGGRRGSSPVWRARCGDTAATAATPNTGNSELCTLGGISCLAFQARLNCGYHLPKALSGGGVFSLAVIYAVTPPEAPCSLVTLNPDNHDNYLFLSERDGAVTLTDNEGRFSLSQPVPPEHGPFRLVMISRGQDGYGLALEGCETRRVEAPAESADKDSLRLDISGISDLFIGCRSHRKGILKTLGSMALADVFLWPHKDILAPVTAASDQQASPERQLLSKYYNEVISRGL